MIGKILLGLLLAGVIYIWWRRSEPRRRGDAAGGGARLLGLDPGASLEQIREAHRRLIAKVHPDAGGSAELATRVNAARDALVEELQRRIS